MPKNIDKIAFHCILTGYGFLQNMSPEKAYYGKWCILIVYA